MSSVDNYATDQVLALAEMEDPRPAMGKPITGATGHVCMQRIRPIIRSGAAQKVRNIVRTKARLNVAARSGPSALEALAN